MCDFDFEITAKFLIKRINVIITYVIKPAVKIMRQEDPLFEEEGWKVQILNEADKIDSVTDFYDFDIDLNKGVSIECLLSNKDGYYKFDEITIPWDWLNGKLELGEMVSILVKTLSQRMNNRRKNKRESDRRMFERLKEEYGW